VVTSGGRARLTAFSVPARTAFSPSFTPAGNFLLFHAENGRTSALMRAELTASGRPGKVVKLLDDGARNFHVRMSPDGRRLAFDSDRDGERGVYVADPDGTRIQRVSGPGYGAVPTWSPQGTQIAFVHASAQRPKVWNLSILNVRSGEARPLSSYRTGQVWAGSWFPDGRKICYSHETELAVADVATRDVSHYASPIKGRLVRTPAVAPDGQRIAFQVYKDGIWILDLRDRSMHRILDDRTAEEFAWSPDGRRLAFHSRRDGSWHLWMLDLS